MCPPPPLGPEPFAGTCCFLLIFVFPITQDMNVLKFTVIILSLLSVFFSFPASVVTATLSHALWDPNSNVKYLSCKKGDMSMCCLKLNVYLSVKSLQREETVLSFDGTKKGESRSWSLEQQVIVIKASLTR